MTLDEEMGMLTVMRFFKNVGLYLGLFIVVCTITIIATTTCLSYYAVCKLATVTRIAPESEPNLAAILKITERYIKDIEDYESLLGEFSSSQVPSVCSVLCNGSSFERDRYSQDRMGYLSSFYSSQKHRALKDPAFRLRMEEMEFLRQAFPASLRGVLKEILSDKEINKVWLALRLEGVLMKEVPFIAQHFAQTKMSLEKLNQLRKLTKSCAGASPKKVLVQECETARE